MRLRYLSALALLALVVPAVPASADTGWATILSGTNEVPANASSGTGTGTFVLNNDQTDFHFHVQYSGLLFNRTLAHIHNAAAGANGSVKRTMAGPGGEVVGPGGTFDTFDGVWTTTQPTEALTAALVGELFAGRLYVNIHSTNWPAGEIRGQIVADVTPTRSYTWGRIKQLYR
jgi:hypothetical protein